MTYKNMKAASPGKLRAKLEKFWSNERGAIVVEFALVLPVFAALFLGYAVAQKSEQLSSYNGKSASTVSDLIAQSEGLQAAEVDGALLAGEAIAGAIDGVKIKIGVFGVKVEEDGTTEVMWARGINGATLPVVGQSYQLTDDLAAEESVVVVSESRLTHTPVVGSGIFGDINMEAKHYYIPRIGADAMVCDDC